MDRSGYKVAFLTIGCRANQADTSCMVSALASDCIIVNLESDRCDFVIVNTCAVTARAESDCRKLIRRARKRHPQAVIVVTGCASQVRPELWSGMPEVDRVVGIYDRERISEIITTTSACKPEVSEPKAGISGPTPLTGHKSRPFIKIQDGCSRGCTYCIVPRARGPERSRPAELVARDIAQLAEAGFEEIVLTGVHLGRWGCDLGLDFNHLLGVLENIPPNVRVRFSSIEPMDLTPELVKSILAHPHICPHLHMPLQSADDSILRAMGRGHTIADFARLVEAGIEANSDAAIGTDIMVGFHGEGESEFQNTLGFVSEQPFAYLHVFTFSPRESTPAARMSNRPPGDAVKEKMKLLKNADKSLRSRFRRAFHGRTLPCLIEAPTHHSGCFTALSHNYIRICVQTPDIGYRAGQVVPIMLDTIND